MTERKITRLQCLDYSQNGAYFVTICTKERKSILSLVGAGVPDRPGHAPKPVGAGVPDRPKYTPPVCTLTWIGEICQNHIRSINESYAHLQITKYVIMPNHIHMIVEITGNDGRSGTPAPTPSTKANAAIPALVSVFKRFVNKDVGQNIWQRSYYDHVIRNERDYLDTWNYIDGNPSKWLEDEYYQK